MPHQTVLLLGGAGFVGSSVCRQLVERASQDPNFATRRILVTTRRAAKAARVQTLPLVEVVQADPHDDATIDRLVGLAHTVVNLIAQLHGSDAAFQRAHVDLPRRLAQTCLRAGGRRIIHISAIGLDAPRLPSRYMRSKAAGEKVLLEMMGPQVTVLRPSVIFGAHDQSTRLFAALQRVAPLMPLAGANALLQPVWVEDVARAVVACIEHRATMGQIYDCAGPDVMTLGELVKASGRMARCERPVVPLPGPVARLQAVLMEAMPGEPMLTRDNLDSLSLPSVADGRRPGLAALGIQSASFKQVGPTYLSPAYGLGRLDALRMLARRT